MLCKSVCLLAVLQSIHVFLLFCSFAYPLSACQYIFMFRTSISRLNTFNSRKLQSVHFFSCIFFILFGACAWCVLYLLISSSFPLNPAFVSVYFCVTLWFYCTCFLDNLSSFFLAPVLQFTASVEFLVSNRILFFLKFLIYFLKISLLKNCMYIQVENTVSVILGLHKVAKIVHSVYIILTQLLPNDDSLYI